MTPLSVTTPVSYSSRQQRSLIFALLIAANSGCHESVLPPSYVLTAAFQSNDSLTFSGDSAAWYAGAPNPSAAFTVDVGRNWGNPTDWPVLVAFAHGDRYLSFPLNATLRIDTLPPDLFRALYRGTVADSGYIAFRDLGHNRAYGEVDLWFTDAIPYLTRMHMTGYFIACLQHEFLPSASCDR
jgi:hypothetical protein